MITFRRAVRENVGLVIGIAGPSGGGKTMSAMRLAQGMAGNKPFAVIDTEAGRAKHYADQFTFDHADLVSPFSPQHYAEAIKAADAAGYPVIVVDSFSHEHAGEGGLLDYHEAELERMAGQDWKKREACKMAAWIKPKSDHKRLVTRLLQVRAHLILAFRAEQKVDIVRGQDGRMELQPKKIASGFSDWIPICEKNILYELTASFLLTPDAPGIPKPIKLQQQMRDFIDLKQPLNEQAGRKLSEWAAGGNGGALSSVPAGMAMSSGEAYSQSPSQGSPGDAPSVFSESSAILDHETLLGDAKTVQDCECVWHEVAKDKRIGSEARATFYKKYQARVKALKVGK